jgi:peroxiredoxin
MPDLDTLPRDLPRPIDDGACGHLLGMTMPSFALPSTRGHAIDLASLPPGRTVIYCYPLTGRPGEALPDDWDSIPGARGRTPQACAFRDHHHELEALGVGAFGLSTQDEDYQREMAERLHLPFPVLSDRDLRFAQALRLPLFEADGKKLIKRLTLIVRDGAIEHVFYPVFPPDENASQVLRWLAARP